MTDLDTKERHSTAMEQEAITLQFHRLMLPFKAVHITVLSDDGSPTGKSGEVTSASGFIRREKEELHLYTSWSVVTGISRIDRQVPPNWRRPALLRIGFRAYDSPVPGVQSIGQLCNFDVPLYEPGSHVALWRQEAQDIPDSALCQLGLRVPRVHDAIRLKLPNLELAGIQITDHGRPGVNIVAPGDKVVVVGYPLRDTVSESDPIGPLALTRFVAANRVDGRPHELILDGCCPAGFEGSPVFVERCSTLDVLGLYTGSEELVGGGPGAIGRVCDMTRCWNESQDWTMPQLSSVDASGALKH